MIGGKVLDASALAALARRRVSALVWFDIAPTLGLTLYLPNLALAEVRAVRPDAAPLLADLLTHPTVDGGLRCSDGESGDPVVRVETEGQFVVTAAQVLDERMSCTDHSG